MIYFGTFVILAIHWMVRANIYSHHPGPKITFLDQNKILIFNAGQLDNTRPCVISLSKLKGVMDSSQSFPIDWSNYGPAHNQQVHGLLGASQGLASNPSTFEAPFPNPFQAGLANDLQPNNDISMEGNEEQEQSAPSVAIAQPKTGSLRRAKGGYLDWNAYKDAIWSLYIGQNKSLSKTIEDMEESHSFKAS